MMTLGPLVVVTLAVTLVRGASIREFDHNVQTKSSSEADQPLIGHLSRFNKCKLKPNPKVNDLIAHRLCIKHILESEDGTDIGGRWGRSVDDKSRRQMAKLNDIIFVNQASNKQRLPRSLEALCAGDLGHYGHDVREYIQWRCKNGYGQLMRRWGRSAAGPASSGNHGSHRLENEVLHGSEGRGIDYFGGDGGDDDDDRMGKRYKTDYKERAKRDEADEMRALVEAYREWRSQNGYGQTSGRWG